MAFEITTKFLEKLVDYVNNGNESEIKNLFIEVHYADIA